MPFVVFMAAFSALAEGPALAGEPVDAAADAERDLTKPTKTHLFVRASAGGSARAIYDSYVVGGEGDVGVGFDSRFGSYGLALGFFGGVVEGSFTTVHGTMGFDASWPVGDFRFGFRARVGYLDVDRFTTQRQFGAYSLGLVGRASYDLTRSDGVAVAIGLEPSADVVVALFNDGASADGAAPLLGGRGFIEVRWRRDD
jgi:hypothetical protein